MNFVRNKVVEHTVLNFCFVASINLFKTFERMCYGISPLACKEQPATIGVQDVELATPFFCSFVRLGIICHHMLGNTEIQCDWTPFVPAQILMTSTAFDFRSLSIDFIK